MGVLLAVFAAQVSPRANIFRRDSGAVSSLSDLKHLMRYNDYTKDPLSGRHPVAAVCSRGDLAVKGAIPKGCYDSKVCLRGMAWPCMLTTLGCRGFAGFCAAGLPQARHAAPHQHGSQQATAVGSFASRWLTMPAASSCFPYGPIAVRCCVG